MGYALNKYTRRRLQRSPAWATTKGSLTPNRNVNRNNPLLFPALLEELMAGRLSEVPLVDTQLG